MVYISVSFVHCVKSYLMFRDIKKNYKIDVSDHLFGLFSSNCVVKTSFVWTWFWVVLHTPRCLSKYKKSMMKMNQWTVLFAWSHLK